MEIFVYILMALIFGGLCLVLVSGELSSRLDLSVTGRIILGCLMGFGVLGVSLKAILLVSLQPAPSLAWISTEARSLWRNDRIASKVEPRGLAYSDPPRAWRPLPSLPPGVKENDSFEKQVTIGRRLYFDRRLSKTGTVSCASCHIIGLGGDDGKRQSTGINGLEGKRNAPTVVNAVYMRRLFWDGRSGSLADQAKGPLTNPVEMGLETLDQAVAIVADDPEYVKLFREIYSSPLEIDQIADTIAAFEQTLIAGPSAYDRFVAGENEALSPSQLRGMKLFDEVGCRSCHEDPWFTVAGASHSSPYRVFPLYRNSVYLARYDLLDDKGRNDAGVWRVPSLRNVELTAPYFHNGSVTDLEEAIRIMASVQRGRPSVEGQFRRPEIQRDAAGRPILVDSTALSNQDIRDIANFLKGLTGRMPFVENPWP